MEIEIGKVLAFGPMSGNTAGLYRFRVTIAIVRKDE
jgi:hypothetical protein